MIWFKDHFTCTGSSIVEHVEERDMPVNTQCHDAERRLMQVGETR